MSGRQRARLNNQRRTPRRAINNRQFGSTIPNQIYGMTFPREMKVTMKYVENLTRTPSSGLAIDYVFLLNSIFDPNSTGTGHQPQGHDQWALFYNRYRVDHVKVRCSVVGVASGYLTMLANNASSPITSSTVGPESPLSQSIYYAANGAAKSKVVNYNLADINGVTRAVYNTDDRYQAQFGASPSEILCLHTIWLDAALGTGIGVYQVEMDFMVTLFDPLQLGDS